MGRLLVSEVVKPPTDAVPLTIAIPAYNRRDSVRALVEAIRDQAQGEDEVIVCDDGSTDGTCEELRSVREIKVISHPVNQGMVSNWNECLTSAARDWICVIHDDDKLEPGGLAALRRACVLANGPALIVHRYAGTGEAFRCSYSAPSPEMILNCPTIPSGAIVHRGVVNELGLFDARFKYSTDLEYFARVASRFPTIVIESPRIVEYRIHGANYQIKTWRNDDFYTQLEEIQCLTIAYAGICDEQRKRQLLQQRMISNLLYMLNLAGRFGDRELVRQVAGQCRRFGARLSVRQKVRVHVAARTGLLPRLK
jgi:glycosyltransferase involved in cell wall biosynthesis